MTETITNKYLRKYLDNVNDENFKDFETELQFSTLLIPESSNGQIPCLDFIGRAFVPLFTDLDEFKKVKKLRSYTPVAHDFDYYLDLIKSDRIPAYVINPESEWLPITRNIAEGLNPFYFLDFERQVFTAKEIREIRDSIDNEDLERYLKNNIETESLLRRLESADLLTLLLSFKKYSAENGVVTTTDSIPLCLCQRNDKNYALLYTSDFNINIMTKNIYKYSQIVNFQYFAEKILIDDLDGIILNMDTDNIIIERESLRTYMRNLKCHIPQDYSGYLFPVGDGNE